ncbi:MAG: REP-associated tyrosine transposase [Bacteroidota bacterium]
MSTGYKIADQQGAYFLTLSVVNWVDVFTRQTYRDIIIENLRYCQKNKGLVIYAYVIMSNHIHLLVQSLEENLSGTIRDFKSYTSKTILENINNVSESRKEWLLKHFEIAAKKHKRNSNYQFWTHNNHPEIIYSDKFVKQKLEYIHNNPVKAGIVRNPEDYIYSSASNYAGLEYILEVEILTTKWTTI